MYNKKYLKISLFLIFIFSVICFVQLACSNTFVTKTSADDLITINKSVYSSVNGYYENGTPKYTETQIVDLNKYYKNIKLEFIVNSPYYSIDYSINDEDVEGNIISTPTNHIVNFTLAHTGIYKITLKAYSNEYQLLETKNFTYKSDNEAPNIDNLSYTQMTQYLKRGEKFNSVVDPTKVYDLYSGVKNIKFVIKDIEENLFSNIYTIDTLDKFDVEITNISTCFMYIYDNAENYTSTELMFDLYDNTPPPVPSYTITPNLVEGVKQRRYEIKLEYSDNDSLSGLSKDQFYILNGKTFVYSGSIVLDKTIDYILTFYTLDNAGNKSEEITLNINKDYFDTNKPLISDVNTEIDFNKEDIYSISFVGSDYNESGIKRAFVKESGRIFKETYVDVYNVFRLDFNPITTQTITIVLEDNAQNQSEYVYTVKYLNNNEIKTLIDNFIKLYKSTDFSKYNDNLKLAINSDIENLKALLLADGTKINELNSLINKINDELNTKITSSFVVSSIPTYISTIFSILIDTTGFTEFKNGDNLTISLNTLNDFEFDDTLSSLGNFFKEGFSLSILYNGESINNPLAFKVTVRMNLPNQYLDRKFELFNNDKKEIVETEIENNTMIFNIDKTTNYVFCIQGGIRPSGQKDLNVETITVFGNTLTKTTFYLIVGICGGVAGLAIIAFIIIIIKRRRF